MPGTDPRGGATAQPRNPQLFTGSSTGEPMSSTDPAATPADNGAQPPAQATTGEPAGANPPTTGEPAEGAASGDEGDPEGKAKITLTEEAFASRLDRAKRQAEREARAAVLRELGIEDPKSLETERAELRTLREQAEQAEREKLTKEQKLEADLEAERRKREALETQLRQVKTESVYDKQDAMIQGIGARHIDPGFWKYARNDFVEYVSTLTPAQTARLGEKDIDRWFAKFAREKPAFAVRQPEPPKKEGDDAAEPPKPRRRPITTTTPAARVATPPNPRGGQSADPSLSPEGKTFRPGQPNSMTRAEARAELKRRGIRGW